MIIVINRQCSTTRTAGWCRYVLYLDSQLRLKERESQGHVQLVLAPTALEEAAQHAVTLDHHTVHAADTNTWTRRYWHVVFVTV